MSKFLGNQYKIIDTNELESITTSNLILLELHCVPTKYIDFVGFIVK